MSCKLHSGYTPCPHGDVERTKAGYCPTCKSAYDRERYLARKGA